MLKQENTYKPTYLRYVHSLPKEHFSSQGQNTERLFPSGQKQESKDKKKKKKNKGLSIVN